MRKNYQWWREYATSAENRAPDGQDAAVPEVSDSVQAQQRAAAATMIAEEANAARLKALLDAAREQADQKSILSAEKRYNEARDDYESARDAMSAQENQEDARGDVPETPFAVEISDAVNRVLERISPQQKAIGFGVVFALLLGVAVGSGGYFMWNAPDGSTVSDRVVVTTERRQEPVNPAIQEVKRPSRETALADGIASPESRPSASDLPTEPIIMPASAATTMQAGKPVIASKPAVIRRKPKRVYSITLPAASAKSVTEKKAAKVRRKSPETAIRVNIRPRGVTRTPAEPPAPNPRVAARDLQVVPAPPPKPPVQIEEAE